MTMLIETIGSTEYLTLEGVPFDIKRLEDWTLVEYPKFRIRHRGNGNVCVSGYIIAPDPANSKLMRRIWLEASSPIHHVLMVSDRVFARTANNSFYWLVGADSQVLEHLAMIILTDLVAKEYGGKGNH